MLKKRLGIEAIERDWNWRKRDYFKIPSSLIISESVKRIGRFAFNSCKVKRVVIPESVEEIRDFAFVGCWNAIIILQKPKKEFEYIGSEAFRGCRDVKEKTRT